MLQRNEAQRTRSQNGRVRSDFTEDTNGICSLSLRTGKMHRPYPALCGPKMPEVSVDHYPKHAQRTADADRQNDRNEEAVATATRETVAT